MGLRGEGKGIRVRMLVEDGSFCEIGRAHV